MLQKMIDDAIEIIPDLSDEDAPPVEVKASKKGD